MIAESIVQLAPTESNLPPDDFLHASNVLTRLKIPSSYLGYVQTACALALSARNPQRLQLVSKWLYPDVAVICGTSAACVERNIRKVRTFVWQNSRDILFEMIGHPLARRPGNARFLAYLATYLLAETNREKP